MQAIWLPAYSGESSGMRDLRDGGSMTCGARFRIEVYELVAISDFITTFSYISCLLADINCTDLSRM
jgi:hypothetical protein